MTIAAGCLMRLRARSHRGRYSELYRLFFTRCRASLADGLATDDHLHRRGRVGLERLAGLAVELNALVARMYAS